MAHARVKIHFDGGADNAVPTGRFRLALTSAHLYIGLVSQAVMETKASGSAYNLPLGHTPEAQEATVWFTLPIETNLYASEVAAFTQRVRDMVLPDTHWTARVLETDHIMGGLDTTAVPS